MSTVTVYDALVSLYTGMYNRAPDYEGLKFWKAAVEDQYGLEMSDPVTDLGFYRDLTEQFAQFPTFQALYMNLTDTQFVNALYSNLQNRVPESQGLAYWVGRLNGTVEAPPDSREKVIADFIYGTLAADYSSPAFAGLDATSRAAAQAAQDAAINKIAVAKYYVEIFGELSDYPDVAASPFFNDDPSSLTYTRDAANLQSWLQTQPTYQFATNSLTQVTENPASIEAGKAAVNNSYATMTNPQSVFTLTDVLSHTFGYTVAIDPIITRETYWGYNPHGHGETDVDNQAGGNTNNLTNEGPVDGGVPLSDLVAVITQYLRYQKSVLDLFDTARTLEGIKDITMKGVTDQLQGAGFLGKDGEIADGFTVADNGDILDGDGNVVGFYNSKTGDYTGNYEIVVTLSDGNTTAAQVALSQQQFDFMNGLLFDAEGNTRLFEVVTTRQPQVTLKDSLGEDVDDAFGNPILVDLYEYSVDGVTTKSYAPIVLTPSANNGGTIESGFTTGFDDTIVAGRLELLHGAYIDGGAGYNTLEIDAKGYFAQPLQLLNIQQVNIQNLPNIYTLPANPVGTPYNPLEDSSYPELDPDPFASYVNSVIDLSRATSIERLVITEGNYEGLQANHVEFPGTLTVNGIRNGAVARFEGAFDHDVNLNYSEGLTGPLTVELLIGMITANLNFAHNTDALHLVSLGGSANSFGSEDLGGRLTNLKISGDAALYINGDLDGSFQDETPITIDASANTGGVNLELTDSQNVTFIGSQGNDIFKVDTQEDGWFEDDSDSEANNSSVTIKGGPGNNLYSIDNAYRLDITSSGNGNNDVEVDWAVIANITVGNGNNHFQIDDVQNATLVAGNGNNRFEVYAWESEDTAHPEQSYDVPAVVTITAGSGKNDIDLEMNYGIGVANITVGNGGNAIDVSGHEVKITSGTGPDVIKVLADVIKINSGGGGDTITLGGWDYDYVGTDELGGNVGVGEDSAEWGDDGALVQVNTGTGPATIILGMDRDYAYDQDNEFPANTSDTGTTSLTAMEGSFITGGAITLIVKTVADLRAATLTGVTRVILDDDSFDLEDAPTANNAEGGINAAVLTLTATQFKAIGADKIGVEGAVFNTHAFVKIIVDQAFAGADGKVSLTELGVDSLSRNIDLLLEVQDGVELSMTAQQLHTRVAQHGVTLANDGNTDFVSGKVVITGGGADFDPFNVTDKVKSIINGQTYYGGSLSSDFQVDGPDSGTDVGAGDPWYNVTVRSSVNGYNRPADAEAEVYITLDSTGTATLVQGAFESWHTNLEIIGDQDITFTGPFGLGEVLGVPTNPFNIDFSALEGVVTNFVVDNFELLGQGGSIVGNADNGYLSEVHISIAADDYVAHQGEDGSGDSDSNGVGFDEPDAQSLVSSGVTRYVVTTIDGPTAAGSVGSDATIILCDTAQDIEVFALRGNYNDTLNLVDAAWGLVFELQGGSTLKADGPTGTSNVGALHANFEWAGGDAQVNLVHSVAGDTRPIYAAGIIVDNADSITVNAGASSAVIDHIDGDDVSDLNFASGANVTIVDTIELPGLSVIDGSDIVGNFTLTLGGMADSSGLSFDASAGTTTLTLDDVSAGTHSSFEATAAATFAIVASGAVNLAKATLTNVDTLSLGTLADLSLTTPPSNSVTLSIAQVEAIGAGDITLTHPGLNGTLNLTNLGSQEFKSTDLGAGVKLGTVSIASGTVALDPDTVLKGGTVTVAAGSTLTLSADQFMALADLDGILPVAPAKPAVINITGLTQAHIKAGFTLAGVSNAGGTVSLAENVNLANTTSLNGFGVTLAEGQTLGLANANQADMLKVVGAANTTVNLMFSSFTGTSPAITDIDVSGFNVDKLRFLDSLVANSNIDDIFDGLLARVVKEVYNNTVALIDQTVTISAGTFFRGNLIADRAEQGTELEDFTLNLQGGTVVQGFVNLPASVETAGLVQTYLKTLTINSTGTTANPQTGSTANIITGAITAGTDGGATENELLDVTINATQTLSIGGSIVFTSKVNADEVASLEVNGTANVSIADLDTKDDDVDGLNVVNNGTGTLTVGINGANIDGTDDLSFTGTGDIVLKVTGTVDLSDDDLAAVSMLVLSQGAVVTLTMEQSDDLGAANIVVAVPGTTTATLNLEGLDGEPFAIANYGEGISVNLLSLADVPVVTLHPDTDLTGIGGLLVHEGQVLNMSAKQFQQLGGAFISGPAGWGTIAGVGGTTDFTVNITNLTQVDVDNDLNGDGVSSNAPGAPWEHLNLTQVTADHKTITLGESVELQSEDDLGGFDVIMGDNMTLTLADIQQANGLNIGGGTNTTLKFTDIVSGAFESIDASGFDVDTLMMLNQLVANRNVDLMFFGLQESVTKVIYTGFGWVEGVNQFVEIEEGVTVPGFLVFNKPEADVEIRNFTLTLHGGTEIESNLRLSASSLEDNLLQMDLRSVTINSLATADDPLTDYVVEGTNRFTGKKANIIGGDITSQGTGNQGTYTSVANNLLTVNINASEALIVEGAIIFESVVGNDDITANDNYAATATLNVTGTAAVTIGDLSTGDDEVDFLVVNHTGTGALTVGLSSLATIDQDPGNNDAITFNGSATAMDTIIISGQVNLSDDTLIEVDAIKLNNGIDSVVNANDPVVTLTLAQVLDIGLDNITAVDTALPYDTATINIVGFDGTEFDATEAVAPVTIGTITMAAGTWTLHPDTDLTGVTQIIVPEGGTLKLTAAQFNQLADAGSIIGLDTNGDSNIDEFFVEIYDLMQSDIANDLNGDGDSNDTFPSPLGAEAFDISDIVGATITIKLGEPTVNLAADTDLGNLADLEFLLTNGQTLGLNNIGQADGLTVTGTGTTTIVYQFGGFATFPNQIDASGYDVTVLKALASAFTVFNSNVEYVIDDLRSSVELRLYEDPEDLGFLDPTLRRVVIEEGITTPSGLLFNDWDPTDEVRELTLTMLGDVTLNGSLRIPTRTDKDTNLVQRFFDELTIKSEGADVNTIAGDVNTVPTAPSAPNTSENNLVNVNIVATQALVVTGDIVFRAVDLVDTPDPDFPAANLNVSGSANVTIQQLNVTDPDLSILNVTNSGTGVLTVTGGSPAILDNTVSTEAGSGPANLETLTFSGSGKIVIGDSNFLNTKTAIDLGALSELDASGMTGELVIGEITNVDSAEFTFTSGTGKTTLTLTSDTLDSTGPDMIPNDPAPTDDTLGWVFDFSNAGVGSAFHLGGGAPLVFVPGSNLTIDLGANTILYIDSDTDLSDLDLTLLPVGGVHIVLADEVELILTAAQANGLHITGVDTDGDGIFGVVNIVDLMNDTPALPPIDLSDIAQNIAGTITLFTNDVTLDPLSDLGFFSVTLKDLSGDSNSLAGQTIRFQTVPQAERAIIIDPNIGDPTDSSSNVVWLFTTIPNPLGVDTSKYDPDLGRLWFTDDLLANEGGLVESLFTTLPSTILRVDFADLTVLNALLVSQPVNRIMEFVNFTTVGNLTYSDIGLNPQEHLQSLTLKLGGQATIGNVVIDDVVAPGTDTALIEFDFLTIESHRALRGGDPVEANNNILASEGFKNNNNGSIQVGETAQPGNINTVGNVGVGLNNGLNLLVVNLNTLGVSTLGDGSIGKGANLNVGTITYGYVPTVSTPIETAEFNVTGANNINVTSVNTSDADIQFFGVDATGFTGVLTAPGASPAFNLDNTEEMTITNGDVASDAAAILFAADGVDDGNETITVNYVLNGVAGSVLVNLAAVDVTNANQVRNAVRDALDALTGIASVNGGAGVAEVSAEGGTPSDPDVLVITSTVVGGTVNTLAATVTDATTNDGGVITLGDDVPVNAGIQGNTLSEIDAEGFDGVLNLGIINDIDGTDDDLNGDGDLLDPGENIAFTMIAGDGVTTATLGEANGRHATLTTDSTWSFTYTGSDAGSALTIAEGAEFEVDANLVFLDVPVVIEGDVDLTMVNLTFNGTCTIWVPAGQSLTLTVEQLLQGDMVDITGEGTVKVIGDATDVTGADLGFHLHTTGVDISGVTIILDPAVGADATQVVELELLDAIGDVDFGQGPAVTGPGFNVIGSAFDDLIDIDPLSAGVPQDDTVSAGLGDDEIWGAYGSNTYIVTSGTDTLKDLYGDDTDPLTPSINPPVDTNDVLIVSLGATALGEVWSEGIAGPSGFVATAATINNGTAILENVWDEDMAIDVSLAGGNFGFTLIGSDSDTVSLDTLIGSAKADIINGGNATQVAAAAVDTLTGNDGADIFGFTIDSSDPVDTPAVETVPGEDEEIWSITDFTADADGAQSLTINYTNNLFSGSFLISDDATIDFSDVDAVGARLASELSIRGLNSSYAAGLVTVVGTPGQSVEINTIVPIGAGFAAAETVTSDDNDVEEETEITVGTGAGGVVTVAGEIYKLTVALAQGTGSFIAEYVAIGNETEAMLASGMAAAVNSQAGALTVDAVVAGNVITLTDEDADNGGFSIAVSQTSGITGSGASALGAGMGVWANAFADTVTDFLTGVDSVQLGIADGTNSNYDEGGTLASYALAYTAADTAFSGDAGLRYFLSSIDGTTGGEIATGLLFFDANGDQNIDGVILLTGVTQGSFDEDDIIL